jgi:cell division protein ZapA (FtsZ GTPase activity inhibitor)
MSEVSLKINVAGIEYPLRLKEGDAENVQKAARLINEKIAEFEKNYSVKEKRDVLSMVMLQVVSQLLQQDKTKSEELVKLQSLLDELNHMVKLHQEKISQ